MALEHAGEAVLHLSRRFARANPDGARHVGGAVKILPAAIDQIDAVRLDRPVARFIHLIMAMRAIGAGGRDGVEAQILELAGRGPEILQLCRRRKFGEPALMRGFVHPVEEIAECRTIAGLRRTMPGLFDRVLLCLGQYCRVARLDNRGASITQSAEDGGDRTVGIDRNPLARHRLQFGNKFFRCAKADGIAEVSAHLVTHLFRRDKQVSGAIGMGEHKAERYRRARYVRTAHIQQPGYRIERGDHRAVEFVGGQPFGNLCALFGAALPGIAIFMDHKPRIAFRGLIAPDSVDRVARNRHKLGTLGF